MVFFVGHSGIFSRYQNMFKRTHPCTKK